MRIELEPAFILHSRPYRETSLLAYVLTEHHGIMHMVCRGAKKKSHNAIQPFTRMLLSWSGRGELVNLNKMEYEYSRYTKNFRAQVQCFYLHELILKLMPKMSPAPELFYLYARTLEAMSDDPCREDVLRLFELELLDIIGHPLHAAFDCQSEQPIMASSYYLYEPDVGPSICEPGLAQWNVVSGTLLEALHNRSLNSDTLKQAKVFLRGLMQHYLQGKPLASRTLLRAS